MRNFVKPLARLDMARNNPLLLLGVVTRALKRDGKEIAEAVSKLKGVTSFEEAVTTASDYVDFA